MNQSHVIEEVWLDRASQPMLLAIGQLIAIVWPKPGVTATDRAHQLANLCEPGDADDCMVPKSFVIREQTRVIAHAAAIPRTIATAAGPMTIVGLSRVATHPDFRGQRLGELVVRAAFALVDNGRFAASLFQTSHAVRPFYERLGCAVVDNCVINSTGVDPTIPPFCDNVVMRYPGDRDWPAGDIDLRGPGY